MGFELHNLRKLSVNSNKLIILPYSTSHLTNLRVLDVRLNCLRALPEDIENLLNLEVLNVSQNFQYLASLPDSIGLCFSLLELDVSYNKITTLPTSIGCLQKLQKLHVEGNPLESPPLEVAKKGVDVVKEYLCGVINGKHETKKGSWIGKMMRHKTFNFNSPLLHGAREKDGFLLSDYRRLDGLASPRQLSMFSPKRLFSPKSHFTR